MKRTQEIGLSDITKRQRLEIYKEMNKIYHEELGVLKEYYDDAIKSGKAKYGWDPGKVFTQGVVSKNEKQGSNFKKFPAITNEVLDYIYGKGPKPDITIKDHDKWMKE
jgi:hypothetical protein